MTKQRVDYCQQIRNHLSSAYQLSEEKINMIMPQFCESLQMMVANLEQLTATDNTSEAVSRAGHTLKGALLNLGLRDLAEKAVILEINSRARAREGDCIRIINELKEEIKNLP